MGPIFQWPKLNKATFVSRINRFCALARDGNTLFPLLVPSSGRMQELLQEGREICWLSGQENRKTRGDLVLVRHGEIWVCIDSRLPNRIFELGVKQGLFPEFYGFERIKREVMRGESRLDFLLGGAQGECLVEVKSVTLVENGTALFPDAPTQRGTRHLKELADHVAHGGKAAVFFLVQREDALRFSPHWERDPLFAQGLRAARDQGVEIIVYSCRVNLEGVHLNGKIKEIIF